MANLEAHLESRIKAFAAELAQEVRASFASQVQALALGNPATPSVAKTAPPKAMSASKPAKRHVPPHCLAEDCRKAHLGPRFSFMCRDHMGTPKAEKKKLLAAWKASEKA